MCFGPVPILLLALLCKRIQEILLLKEYSYPYFLESDTKAIVTDNASFSWNFDPDEKKQDDDKKSQNQDDENDEQCFLKTADTSNL